MWAYQLVIEWEDEYKTPLAFRRKLRISIEIPKEPSINLVFLGDCKLKNVEKIVHPDK